MGEMLEEGITPLHPRRGKEEREDAQHVDMEDRKGGGKLKQEENAATQAAKQQSSLTCRTRE